MLRSIPAILAALALYAQFPVVMNRYDRAGTSANSREKILSASNVTQASFGKLYILLLLLSVYVAGCASNEQGSLNQI